MPSYGSLHSPSLRKMNGQMDSKGRRTSGMRSMSMDNIIGDPFALATISISVLAWFIAFVGSAIATAQHTVVGFPNFSWFAIAHMLCLIIGVFVVVASDTTQTYHVALVGFLSAGLILCSSSVDQLIYTSDGAKQAASAGFILLCMVNIIWIFYFGSTPSAVPRAYLDSFALHKERPTSHSGRGMSTGFGNGRPNTSVSSNVPPQMYTSAQLGGFETSSPVAGFSSNDRGSTQAKFGNSTSPTSGLGATGATEPVGEVVPPTEYPYKARAIYSYEANPDDANEISFSKHEVLDVSDVSGRWWQARKTTGETGIAPSNYLLLL